MSKARVYVTCDGCLYRFTEAAWRHYLESVVRGQEAHPDDFATALHTITAEVSVIERHEAQMLLGMAERRRLGLSAEPSPEPDSEPPENDGEQWRGGEAAAFEAERMAEWGKL